MPKANFAHQAIFHAFVEDDVDVIKRRHEQDLIPRRLQLTDTGPSIALFHAAARQGAINCIRFLVDVGFPHSELNQDGQDAWEVAKTPEIARLLKGYDRVARSITARRHVVTRPTLTRHAGL